MRFAVKTFGCQMNEHDSARVAAWLAERGYERADVSDADVVVVNTCTIRENADNKLYGFLGRLKEAKRSRPGMRIVVAGCLAQKEREGLLERAPFVDVVVGTYNIHRIPELLEAAEQGPICEIWEGYEGEAPAYFSQGEPLAEGGRSAHSAYVSIQTGCNNSCTFCIVPYVRGPEVSRPFGEVLGEVRKLARSGVSEVTLLGQNVNSYGRDLTLAARQGRVSPELLPQVIGERAHREWRDGRLRVRPLFADLLAEVASVEGIRRVRFTSPHPKDLLPETMEVMASCEAVCDHLHLPLQAGSDAVLRRMQRGYTAARYLEKLRMARSIVPSLAVSTDVIVGFPGESEEDFEKTLEVCAEAGYDSAFMFIYSPRPFTKAAEWRELFVPREVAAARMERLKALIDRSALARNTALLGASVEVLVEGPSKKDPHLLTGRTTQNKVVNFSCQGTPPEPGSYVTVRVDRALSHYLLGHMERIEASPRSPRRLPVAVA